MLKLTAKGCLSPEQYDGFDHLRQALFWDWDAPMFVHTAYFDDSGEKETQVLLVGGYVATVANWPRVATA